MKNSKSPVKSIMHSRKDSANSQTASISPLELDDTNTNTFQLETSGPHAIITNRDRSKLKQQESSELLGKDTRFLWYSNDSIHSKFSEDPVHIEIPDNMSHSGKFDTGTVKALDYCRKTVLHPYLMILTAIGWRRIYNNSSSFSLLKRIINFLYPCIVILILLFLYVVSCYTCKNGTEIVISNSDFNTLYVSSSSENSRNDSRNNNKPTHCQHLVSLYFIPYIMHLMAYLYALYLFRFKSSEHIDALMEMAFVQASKRQTTGLLQNKILFYLRSILVLCTSWQILMIIEQVVYIILYTEHIDFTNTTRLDSDNLFGNTSVISVFISLSSAVILKLATGIVFIILILHYSTQCILLFSLTKGICQGLREKSASLSTAMQDLYQCRQFLSRLNKEAANSVSLCLLTIFIYLLIDTIEAFKLILGIASKFEQEIWTIVHLSMDILLWTIALFIPVIMATTLQASFKKLKNMTFSILLFKYKNSTMEELNQFFNYANLIPFKVKLFNITMRSNVVTLFLLAIFVCFISILVINSNL